MSAHFSYHKKMYLTAINHLGGCMVVFALLFFPIKSRAAVTDFFQTSEALEINLFTAPIISLIPDPSLQDESLVTMELLPMGDTDFGDGPLFLHLFRRNPVVNTLSEILFAFLIEDENDPNSFVPFTFIPMFGESGWVLGVASGVQDFIIAALPSSTFDVPVGSSAQATILDKNVTHLEFNFATDLQNLQAPLGNNNFILSHFFDFALPSANNPLEFMMVGEIEAPDQSGDHLLAYFGAKADLQNGDLKLSAVPLTQLGINVGPPPNGQGSSTIGSTLMGDYNGDTCTDVAILIDLQETAAHDFLMMMKGKCDGSSPPFEVTNPNIHDLGDNFAMIDLVNGDFNKDGKLDLGIVYAYPGSTLGAENSRIDIIEDALGAFTLHAGPTLPPQPIVALFADRMDCNVDFIDDIVVASAEFKFSNTNEPESIHSSDVICYLSDGSGGFPTQTMVYPKELITPSVPTDLEDDISDVILATSVGNIGCGTGWTGVSFFTTNDGGGNNNNNCDGECNNGGANMPTGAYTALFAEHSDCEAVNQALQGGDDEGGGDGGGGGGGGNFFIAGAGCLSRMVPGSSPIPWAFLAISILPLLVFAGHRWVRKGVKIQ